MSPLKIKLQQVKDELIEYYDNKLRLAEQRHDECIALRKEASTTQARRINALLEENVKLTREIEELNEALDEVMGK